MVQRLVVHAGFHKTGTTTLQNTLATHRDLLRPHAHVILRADMKGLCEAARAYSKTRTDFDLGLVAYEAALLAEGWDSDTVLMSSEDLSGHMPGRHDLTDYRAAIALAATMTDTWRATCPDIEITWVYTTRAAVPWLASCHVQHLRAARMTLDADAYADAFAGSAEHNDIAARVRDRVIDADVHTLALEAHRSNLLDPMLALGGLSENLRVQITPLPPANTSPSTDTIAEMLALNRSDLPQSKWRAAQNALNRRSN
ncbi:MAG: hypothetical protein ABJM65_01510 [Ascidiaceihabitans sp.]|uniref:hypothetical protein n=1 Tax=Ascidiaceihabitans sp. TaxID=1872644 RepID=UPI0032981E08